MKNLYIFLYCTYVHNIYRNRSRLVRRNIHLNIEVSFINHHCCNAGVIYALKAPFFFLKNLHYI